MKVHFPMNLIYRDLIYVDPWNRLSIQLMKKHGIRYFKCNNVMKHPDFPGINLVFGRIHRWEASKMHDTLLELQNENETGSYDEACTVLRSLLQQWIKDTEEGERLRC